MRDLHMDDILKQNESSVRMCANFKFEFWKQESEAFH
jgi:hypothetical protein